MRDDGKLDSELNERLIKSIEGSAKTVIFGRLVDKNRLLISLLGILSFVNLIVFTLNS